jgi:predicted O-methyltransferase YrrM
MTAGHDALAALRRSRPSFHGIDIGRPGNLQIGEDVLGWLVENIPGGGTTLETGSGYTTVVFASIARRHIAVAPAATEFAAIRAFCQEEGISLTSLDERVARSQDVLPTGDWADLDGVLIDGDHSFPLPFLDYYFLADRVREGGLLLVDDCQLRTGHVLRQFLVEEPGWEHVRDLGKTAAFRRTSGPAPTSRWWVDQPWLAPVYAVPGDTLRTQLAAARTQLRLRSRLTQWR